MIYFLNDTKNGTYLLWETDDITGTGIRAYIGERNSSDISWWRARPLTDPKLTLTEYDYDEDTVSWFIDQPHIVLIQSFNHIDDYFVWIDQHPELLI